MTLGDTDLDADPSSPQQPKLLRSGAQVGSLVAGRSVPKSGAQPLVATHMLRRPRPIRTRQEVDGEGCRDFAN